MKLSTITIAAAFSTASAAPANLLEDRASGIQGFDISGWQSTVDFQGAYNSGARFVIIKATEGTSHIDSEFSNHYTGATNAGLIRGGYHFALPDVSSGSEQATFFLAHGGGWSGDGRTLPGMLDIEYNPYGDNTCYGLSSQAMVSWIQDFVNTYHGKTGRYPMIYSTADWWTSCTGNSNAFSSTCPLVLARFGSSPGNIPGGWPYQTIWQNADSYTYGGDSDFFNGDMTQLKKMATG
ncbi:hypothetical protein GP486_008444 [Trichoglossum hirsutum]|uniref:N,O-diacetylmuramidase n=1 Tax=Trichoglossum hirsutum TaxID=265104 RepID=A0A9P8ID00_9PEZI|nr:hypothetical protein GP486_008444 [Trichoglossum hirsutum]